jgi:hypothetical protein
MLAPRPSATDVFDTERIVPGFVAPPLAAEEPRQSDLESADHKMRSWQSDVVGPIEPGSEVHKREVCRMFRETFNPYRPAVLRWPKLDAATLHRIVSLPIWDIAVHTEGKARLRMAAYARTVADSRMRDAIALNAWEESRHKEVLEQLVAAYGIQLAPEPVYQFPQDPEWGYLTIGYSECVDSFFAFGLFAVALRSGLFPTELVDTFEPVIQEECRHILLFANWVGWYRAQLPWWRRVGFEIKVAAAWVVLAYDRIGLVRTMDTNGGVQEQDYNFTVTGAKSVSDTDISVRELMEICLSENDRRFSGYDSRLLRPLTLPRLVRLALRFMPKKKRAAGHPLLNAE